MGFAWVCSGVPFFDEKLNMGEATGVAMALAAVALLGRLGA
jgi:multidrug transporter EmrE-like cation transporter